MLEKTELTWDTGALRGAVTSYICDAYRKLNSASETISSLPTPKGCESARNLCEIVDNIKSSVGAVKAAIQSAADALEHNEFSIIDLIWDKLREFFNLPPDIDIDDDEEKLKDPLSGNNPFESETDKMAKELARKYHIDTRGKTAEEIIQEAKGLARKAKEDEAILLDADNKKDNRQPVEVEILDTDLKKIKQKWDAGYLCAPLGRIYYKGKDGRYTKETWCNLKTSELVANMKNQHNLDLEYWVRDDGVCMYGDYVMVATDVPHMDGTEKDAEYHYGDLVETSLGTGMVVDYCEKAEYTRKGWTHDDVYTSRKIDVWYDIYTMWGDGGEYEHKAYAKENEPSWGAHYKETVTEDTTGIANKNEIVKPRTEEK